MFWFALARSLEKNIRDSVKGEWLRPFAAYLSPTFEVRFNIYAANVERQLSQASQALPCIFRPNNSTYRYNLYSELSEVCLASIFSLRITNIFISPETVLILNALSTLETHYISKSTMKMNEVVSQAFAGGLRAPPSTPEGLSIARAIANELDAGKFDPLLVRSLSKNVLVVKSIISRADALVCHYRSGYDAA